MIVMTEEGGELINKGFPQIVSNVSKLANMLRYIAEKDTYREGFNTRYMNDLSKREHRCTYEYFLQK